MTIKRISDFEIKYFINRSITPSSKHRIEIQRTCDNCYEKHPLCSMSNGLQCCLNCSQDIEALTHRLPPKTEREIE